MVGHPRYRELILSSPFILRGEGSRRRASVVKEFEGILNGLPTGLLGDFLPVEFLLFTLYQLHDNRFLWCRWDGAVCVQAI